jgi:hypothetical protein
MRKLNLQFRDLEERLPIIHHCRWAVGCKLFIVSLLWTLNVSYTFYHAWQVLKGVDWCNSGCWVNCSAQILSSVGLDCHQTAWNIMKLQRSTRFFCKDSYDFKFCSKTAQIKHKLPTKYMLHSGSQPSTTDKTHHSHLGTASLVPLPLFIKQ